MVFLVIVLELVVNSVQRATRGDAATAVRLKKWG